VTVIDLEWARIERDMRKLNAMLDDIDRLHARMIRVLAKWGPITDEMRKCLERN